MIVQNTPFMIQLAIFDLDGTLLNTLEDLANSVNYILHRHGLPEHPLSAYPYMVGNGIRCLIERALPLNDQSEGRINSLLKEFVTYYQAHKTDYTCPYPGIPELLKSLYHQGIILAVASNKYHEGTLELIRHYFGTTLFQVILGQRNGFPVKPDPAIVNEILGKTGVAPQHTLYIGDSSVDMQTAANGKVLSVGVTWGFRTREELEDSGARYIVNRPEEILKLVEHLKINE